MNLIRPLFLILACSIIAYGVNAQKRGNVWCFGDSALIDFNSGVPVPGISSLDTRGTCISISDNNGDLLFYGNTRAGIGNPSGLLWNKVNQLMTNGDSIAGSGWYHELVIAPKPADDSLYYLFSIGVTYSIGLLYSIIDMKGDNGLGAVIQKKYTTFR
ncbi:MAG: hypothetical protein IPI23_17195 [Bacteroidetes bacterium]|nr:hypothetical protein [Bacteroidota bacterium]